MQTITFKCNLTIVKQLEQIKKELLKQGYEMNTSQTIRYCINKTYLKLTK